MRANGVNATCVCLRAGGCIACLFSCGEEGMRAGDLTDWLLHALLGVMRVGASGVCR